MGRPLIRSIVTDYFNEPNTEAQLWVLGWIYSDGYNSDVSMSITVHIQDGEVLEKIKHCMGSERIRITKPSYRNVHILQTSSRYLARQLTKLGCVRRKSLIVKYPDWIQDRNLHRAFLRGVFEGDGSLYGTGRRASMMAEIASGSLDFLTALQRVIKELIGLDTTIGYTNGKPRKLKIIGGVKNVETFMDFLYEGVPIELTMDRKRNKWLELKAMLSNPRPKRTWNINAKRRTAFHIRSPRGDIYHSDTMVPFCKEYNLSVACLHSVVVKRPHNFTTRGWRLPTEEELHIALANGTVIEKRYPIEPVVSEPAPI